MKSKPRINLKSCALLACTVPLQAQTTLNWTGGVNGGNTFLSTAGNWLENQSPSASTDLIIADRNGDTDAIPSLLFNGDYSIRSITADNNENRFSSSFGLRLVTSSASNSTLVRTISFEEAGIPIWKAANNATLRFQKNVFLDTSTYISLSGLNLDLNYSGFGIVDVDSTSTIRVVSGNVRGTGGLQKTGAGVLSIESAGTYTGGVRILGGVLSVNSPGGLGAAPAEFVANQVVIDGGTLVFDGATVASGTNRGFQIGQNNGTIQVLQTAVNILGAISGPGELTKSGGFILGLYGTNTHAGGTIVQQGRIRYNNSSSFGSGKISMSNGTGIYATAADINLANDIDLNGNVRFGDGTASTQLFSGNIDLTGQNRAIQVSSPTVWSGEISNGGLTVAGDSPALSLTLDGDNSYTGDTTVSSGTLVVNGILASVSTSIASGATLSGNGSLAGLTTVNGTLAPGESPGTMSFSSLTLGNDSTVSFEITGGSLFAGDSDLLQVESSLTIGSGVILDLIQLGNHTPGDKITLFSYSTLEGMLSGINQGETFIAGGGLWEIDYFDDTPGINGGDGSGFVTITAVPEPASALLGGLGILMLLTRRKVV